MTTATATEGRPAPATYVPSVDALGTPAARPASGRCGRLRPCRLASTDPT
jgi:hypothetical protein